ncbi:MAG: signal peptidase I [Acidobacteriota bacterium]|nr:signal peptidase I [Acidobacteriota bacterium]
MKLFKKKPKKKKPDEPKHSPVREILEILFYGLALLVFFTKFVWQNFQIPTQSMENTLLIGDHIAANTFIFNNASDFEKKIFPFRDVKRGDIVVFKYPNNARQDWIKRCIGVPGDTFEIKNDQVYINGRELKEAYPFYKLPQDKGGSRDPENRYYPKGYHEHEPGLENAIYQQEQSLTLNEVITATKSSLYSYKSLDKETFDAVNARLAAASQDGVMRIPEGFYLMIGDNRNRSYDSRAWGLVPKELIEGRAYFVWWSYGEDENSHQLQGGDLIWSYLRVPFTFWTRTHWKETFTLIK